MFPPPPSTSSPRPRRNHPLNCFVVLNQWKILGARLNGTSQPFFSVNVFGKYFAPWNSKFRGIKSHCSLLHPELDFSTAPNKILFQLTWNMAHPICLRPHLLSSGNQTTRRQKAKKMNLRVDRSWRDPSFPRVNAGCHYYVQPPRNSLRVIINVQ